MRRPGLEAPETMTKTTPLWLAVALLACGLVMTGCGSGTETSPGQPASASGGTAEQPYSSSTESGAPAAAPSQSGTLGEGEQTGAAVGTGDSGDGAENSDGTDSMVVADGTGSSSATDGTLSGSGSSSGGTGSVAGEVSSGSDPGSSGDTGTGGGLGSGTGTSGPGAPENSSGSTSGTPGSGRPAVTSADLESRYPGVKIASSPKAWTPEELALLDETLSKLPAACYQNTIIRRSSAINGDPGTYGVCRTGPTGPAEVEISDKSLSTLASDRIDFPTPPYSDKESREKQFQATIAHELTHRLLRYNPGNKFHSDLSRQPWIAGENGWAAQFGWSYNPTTHKWALDSARSGEAPSGYAGSENPSEDICESMMFYLYDPQRLRAASPERYRFIKEVLGVAEQPDASTTYPPPGGSR
jgi:hypothetical protein